MTGEIHQGGAVAAFGAAPEEARAAVVLVHGRGATADGMLDLARALDRPDLVWLAPQAAGGAWYPHSFLAPLAANEPGLSSGIALVHGLVESLADRGVPGERVVLLGFSQGACLALETAARHARRYGGVVALTGGLIGPPGTPREYPGSLDGTPIFLGAGDPDPHVPWWRVEESAAALEGLGAAVTSRRYPDMGHTISADELAEARRILDAAAGQEQPTTGS